MFLDPGVYVPLRGIPNRPPRNVYEHVIVCKLTASAAALVRVLQRETRFVWS